MSNPHKPKLFRNGGLSLLIRLCGACIAFALTATLARLLGVDGFGHYSFVLSVLMMLAIPAQMGLPQLVIRETARAKHDNNPARLRGIWIWSQRVALILSTIIIATIFVWLSLGSIPPSTSMTFYVGFALIPLVSVLGIRSAAIRGLGYVLIGQLPNVVIKPAVFLVLTLGLMTITAKNFSPITAMLCNVMAASVALIFTTIVLNSKADNLVRQIPAFHSKAWLSSALPLGAIAGFQIVNNNLDIMMIGFLRPIEDVGVYKVVVSSANLVVFGLGAVNAVISPQIARLCHSGEIQSLQIIATHAARLSLGFSVFAAAGYGLLGAVMLKTVFGEPYQAGYSALMIIIVGQVINAGFGSVGALLNMSGNERDTLKGMGIAAVVNVVLNITLIPRWGIEGAALATAITLLTWNWLLYRRVWKKIGIKSTAI